MQRLFGRKIAAQAHDVVTVPHDFHVTSPRAGGCGGDVVARHALYAETAAAAAHADLRGIAAEVWLCPCAHHA